MKKVITFCIVIINVTLSVAQTDSVFWFAIPRVTPNHPASGGGGTPIFLKFCSIGPTTVTISMPANPSFPVRSKTLAGAGADSFNLSQFNNVNPSLSIETAPENTKLNRGLLITSSLSKITAYWEINNQWNKDIWSLKGNNALGTDFYVPFQNTYPMDTDAFKTPYPTQRPYESIDIVATEDSTVVTVYPTSAIAGHPSGPITVNLNRGQTYSFKSRFNVGPGPAFKTISLSGTYIHSNKKIAVSIKNDSVHLGSAMDVNGDQMIPDTIAGHDYVVMRGKVNTSAGCPETVPKGVATGEFAYIVGIEPGPAANITANGNPLGTVVQKGTLRCPIDSNAVYIHSDKKIMVYHLSGFGCETGGAVIPTIDGCTGSKSVSFYKTAPVINSDKFFVNIMATSAGKKNLFMEYYKMVGINVVGPFIAQIPETYFEPVAGTGSTWYVLKSWKKSIDTIANETPCRVFVKLNEKGRFHLGIIAGGKTGSGCKYGYFSDFKEEKPNVIVNNNHSLDSYQPCPGDTVYLTAGGGDSYHWSLVGSPQITYLSDTTIPNPIATPPAGGTYTYKVIITSECYPNDTSYINIFAAPQLSAFMAVDKTNSCSPDIAFSFFNNSTGNRFKFYWDFNNDNKPDTITYNKNDFIHRFPRNKGFTPNVYYVTLSARDSAYMCVDKTTTKITVYPEIHSRFIPVNYNLKGCDSVTVKFNNTSYGDTLYKNFRWNFGDGNTTPDKSPTHKFTNYLGSIDSVYHIKLVATSKYYCKDSTYDSVRVHPYLKADFTIDSAMGCSDLPVKIKNRSLGRVDTFRWNYGKVPGDYIIKFRKDTIITYIDTGASPKNYLVHLKVSNTKGVCTDTLTRAIKVYPKVRAAFLKSISKGCNPLQDTFRNTKNKTPVQYRWEFGDGSSSSDSTVVTHLFENYSSNDTTFKTRLFVSSNIYGCKASDSALVKVFRRIDAGFTVSPATGCGGFKTTFHNASSGGITLYTMDYGDDTVKSWTVMPATFTKIYNNLDSTDTVYTAKLVVFNDSGCNAPYSANITVHPTVEAKFKINKLRSCNPFPALFTNESSRKRANQFKWEFGDGVSSFSSDTFISHSYTNIDSVSRNDTVKLTATSSTTGCWDTATVPIVIYSYVKADFKISDAHVCSYQLDSLTDNSSPGLKKWYWDVAGNGKIDSTKGTKALIQKKYVNNTSDSVIIWSKLKVRNNNFCFDSIKFPIVVYRHINLNFNVPVAACDSDLVSFGNTTDTAAIYHNWDFGDGTSSTQKTPSHTYFHLFPTSKPYTVKLTEVSKFQCDTTSTRNIAIRAYIKADYKINDAHLCSYQLDSIKDNSLGGIKKWYWDYKGNGYKGSVKLDSISKNKPLPVKYNNTTADSVTKYLKLYVRNDNFCYDSLIRPIVVYRHINLIFNVPVSACDSDLVSFGNTTDPAAIYHNWDFGDGTSSTQKTPSHNYFHLFPTPKLFTVKLTEVSKFQCDTSASRTISIDAYINADFSINKSAICPGDSMLFVNTSPAGAFTNKWNIDGNLFTYNVKNVPFWRKIQNPVDTVLKLIKIKLYTYTQSGNCFDSLIRPATLFPRPVANFRTSDNKYSGCNPFRVTFKNLSNSIAKDYTWNFGDSSSSSAKDTISHLFENFYSHSKTINVSLHVSSVNNCTDDTSKPIFVFPFIEADFKVKKADVCSDSSVEITDNTPGGVTFRKWDYDGNGVFDDSSTLKLPPFLHKYPNPDTSKILVQYLKMVVRNNNKCYASDSTPITVYPKIVSDFTYDTNLGCTPLHVSFTKQSLSLLSFNWNFGDGNTSSLPNPEHEYVNAADTDRTYHANLTAISQYLCASTSYHDIKVYSYINADFKVPEANMCSGVKTLVVDTSLFNRNIAKREWDFNSKYGFIDTLNEYPRIYLHPKDTLNIEVTLPLKLTVYNIHNCPSTISRNVSIYPEVRAQFAMDSSVVCSPYPVKFTNQTNIAATDYNWSFGEGSTSSLKDPVKNYINYTDRDDSFNVQLISVSKYLCSDTIIKKVYINHKPKPKFNIAKTIDCPPFNVVIHNNSITSNSKFRWSFGDSSSDTITYNYNDFNHPYNNSTDTFESYQLKLTAITNKFCSDSTSIPIQVYPKVTAGFNTLTSGCTPFTDTLDNTSSTSASYFYWDFGDSEFSNQKSPLHEFFNNGISNDTFPIMLRALSAYGCRDSIFHNLVVYPAPNANFLTDKVFDYYPDATFNFYDLTNKGPWTYEWDFGDGTKQTNINDTVTYTYKHWGNYKVILHVANGLCSDIAEQNLILFAPVPIAKFDSSAAGCSPVTVFFNSDSTKWANTYLWQFDDGTTSEKKNPSHTYYNPGDFNVVLTVTGDGGTSFDQKMVRVYPNPIAQFSIRPTTVMIPNATVRFFNSTPGDFNQYNWYFGDGGESSLSDPVYKYSKVGTYTIKLVVTSENYCLDSTTNNVTVGATGKIKFPNAFLPNMNGPSGGKYNITDVNVFYPNYDGVAEYHLEIYNRWGELIFISDDVATGWDGYYKGKLCPQGVYVYKAKGKFYDNQAFNVVGDVTLLLKKEIK